MTSMCHTTLAPAVGAPLVGAQHRHRVPVPSQGRHEAYPYTTHRIRVVLEIIDHRFRRLAPGDTRGILGRKGAALLERLLGERG